MYGLGSGSPGRRNPIRWVPGRTRGARAGGISGSPGRRNPIGRGPGGNCFGGGGPGSNCFGGGGPGGNSFGGSGSGGNVTATSASSVTATSASSVIATSAPSTSPATPIATPMTTGDVNSPHSSGVPLDMRCSIFSLACSAAARVVSGSDGKNARTAARPRSTFSSDGSTMKSAICRATIPQDVLHRIAPTALPRSSIIVSDEPLSRETNYRTEFVAVHQQPAPGRLLDAPAYGRCPRCERQLLGQRRLRLLFPAQLELPTCLYASAREPIL